MVNRGLGQLSSQVWKHYVERERRVRVMTTGAAAHAVKYISKQNGTVLHGWES